MSSAYYNEHDPGAAEWLRELIKADLIAPGVVDQRDIRDVTPADLLGFDQHHFFAGIGVWSYALRKAGWPDTQPCWTGSCPCQPFSTAGKRKGTADERHLWPSWFWLIDKQRPDVIFGEQVANGDGAAWLDLVSTDLEAGGYTCGAVNLPACGVGAPHIRQRLFFVADSKINGDRPFDRQSKPGVRQEKQARGHSISGSMANTSGISRGLPKRSERRTLSEVVGCGQADRVGDSDGALGRRNSGSISPEEAKGNREGIFDGRESHELKSAGPVNGFWSDAEWIWCKDGKHRPVEPGSFPLVNGAPGRVGLLRGYGNAINAEVAIEFISAYRKTVSLYE